MTAVDDVPGPDRRPVLTPLPGEGDLGLVDALAQLTFAVQGALTRIAADHGLSIAAARLLGIVRDRQPTIGELATFVGYTLSWSLLFSQLWSKHLPVPTRKKPKPGEASSK